jgi:hypothetical protein
LGAEHRPLKLARGDARPRRRILATPRSRYPLPQHRAPSGPRPVHPTRPCEDLRHLPRASHLATFGADLVRAVRLTPPGLGARTAYSFSIPKIRLSILVHLPRPGLSVGRKAAGQRLCRGLREHPDTLQVHSVRKEPLPRHMHSKSRAPRRTTPDPVFNSSTRSAAAMKWPVVASALSPSAVATVCEGQEAQDDLPLAPGRTRDHVRGSADAAVTQTPVAMSWSIGRMSVVCTPCPSMMSWLRRISRSV